MYIGQLEINISTGNSMTIHGVVFWLESLLDLIDQLLKILCDSQVTQKLNIVSLIEAQRIADKLLNTDDMSPNRIVIKKVRSDGDLDQRILWQLLL